jgi:hypothetical protein
MLWFFLGVVLGVLIGGYNRESRKRERAWLRMVHRYYSADPDDER